jgi:hypothetical protein
MQTPVNDLASPAQGVPSAIDGKKESIARGMDSAAATLREKAGTMPGGERVASAAYKAAELMETASEYLAERDARDILADMQQMLRKHPGATLLTAATIGFLLARSFSRH